MSATARPHPIRDPAAFLATLPEPRRRDVLKAMGATLALSAAGCDGPPDGVAIPFIQQPEGTVPGRPRFYATCTLLDGFGEPVVAEVHRGRPTRLDGNALVPGYTIAASIFAQAEVLSVYDPDRPREARLAGSAIDRPRVTALLRRLAAAADRDGGKGLRILTGPVTSPTLLRLLEAMRARWPEVGTHRHHPLETPHTAAARLAFGEPAVLHPRLAAAAGIVSLGADPLGPGPAQIPNAIAWGRRRAAIQAGAPYVPLLVAEAAPTLTGTQADDRLAVAESRLPRLLTALAEQLGLAGPAGTPELTLAERAWVDRAARRLAADGPGGLLLAGSYLPPETQALAMVLSARLGQLGRTLVATPPILPETAPLPDLVAAMAAGAVETLLILEGDPVRTAPPELEFAAALARVRLPIAAGCRLDRTAMACRWHIPLLHPLERWGDARTVGGLAVLQQPTVRPLTDTWQPLELLGRLLGDDRAAQEVLRETWAERLPEGTAWDDVLRQGFVPGSEPSPLELTPNDIPDLAMPDEVALAAAEAEGLPVEVLFRPDPTLYGGEGAGNAWLQELPKPFTTAAWSQPVWLAPDVALALGVATGDGVTVTVAGNGISGPAFVMPGQAAGTVVLFLGGGTTGDNAAGYEAAVIRPGDSPWLATGRIARASAAPPLIMDRAPATMEPNGRLIRTVPEAAAVLDDGSRMAPSGSGVDWDYPVHAWAMAVDLDRCIGCNTCVIACQAENNIPTVGPGEVDRDRALHWLRVSPYLPEADAAPAFLPVLCMHCEKAPCEVGCPVKATVHGPDGLNQMIYNRCIGTRTCAAYCPYEVRRFNYLPYAEAVAPAAAAQWNPDVTVRARGVMEKCTYCTQRISAARIQAKLEGRPIRDGEIETACQAACPTRVFTFGDLNDPDSAVSRRLASGRTYGLLTELGTQPRTRYLARIRPGVVA